MVSRGKVKEKVQPRPGAVSTQMRPPWASMTRLTMASPSPKPWTVPFPLPPVEDFKDMGQIFLGDARPLVVNSKPDGRVFHLGRQFNLAAPRTILDGIFQQVLQHPPEQERVRPEDRNLGGKFGFQGDAFGFRQGLQQRQDFPALLSRRSGLGAGGSESAGPGGRIPETGQ